MNKIKKYTFLDGKIVNKKDANISIASSSVLYGLSLYTVFSAKYVNKKLIIFRLDKHWERLEKNMEKIQFGKIESIISFDDFKKNIKKLIKKNKIKEDVFFRATIHISSEIAGARISNLEKKMSIFVYPSENILPQKGAKIKITKWERASEKSIPPSLKVNGLYVNSCLGKQDALDSGFDDSLFINKKGFVSELSAANIFHIKKNIVYTPDLKSDILEGITRNTIINIFKKNKIKIVEKKITKKELLSADEVFACGTSAFISPIIKIDEKKIPIGNFTKKIMKDLKKLQETKNNFTEIL